MAGRVLLAEEASFVSAGHRIRRTTGQHLGQMLVDLSERR